MYSHRHKYKMGEKGAMLGIIINLALASFKFAAGIIGRSNALIADALHTTSDLLTSAVVFVGFKIAQVPPDKHHPYGHARAESIAAKIVSIVLIALGVKVLLQSFGVFHRHDFYKPGLIALVAAFVSIIVKYVFYIYVKKIGKKIESSSLIADAYHHKSDAISSIAALVGIAGARMGFEFMDPLAGIIVAGFVIKVGIDNFHTAYDELMDAAPPDELIERIKKATIATEGVKAIKKMNARKLGIDLHIDMTIDVDRFITVEEAHLITVKAKRNIIKNVPNAAEILIHVEPHLPKEK